jgi:hypothetical protein
LNSAQSISKIISQVLDQKLDQCEFLELWDFEWNEYELFDETFDWLESLLEDELSSEFECDK